MIAALEARFVVLGLDLFLRQVAVVGMARVEQLLHRRHMQLEALGLEIGAFIPVEAEPCERLGDGVDEFLGGLLGVGVLDPQHECAAVLRA